MKLLSRMILGLAANLIGLFSADYLISGFTIQPSVKSFIIAALFLTGVNLFIKPIVKFFMTPFIIVTFGLFTVVINAFLLLALDFFLEELTIEGLLAAIFAALIIGAVNYLMRFADKAAHRGNG